MPPLYAQASTFAGPVDQLMLALLAFCVLVSTGICVTIAYFGIRYHKSNKTVDRTNPPDHSLPLEIGWTFAAVVVVMGIFYWGAAIYVRQSHAPDNALSIYVVGKQWMWKTYYPDGQQEINGLHVPTGRPVKLVMISQDVVHSFYIPAFRVKQDVIPGRYTSMWFEATVPGSYHLFCAEYCGTKHSEMVGRVEVMEPARFQDWLAGRGGAVTLAQAGAQLYQKLGCAACHQSQAGGSQRGPKLEGLFGAPVKLADGRTIVADDNYLRESIVDPRAKIVSGYEPVMPSYEGQVTTEEITALLSYVKSLATSENK